METKSNLQFGVIRILVCLLWSNTYKDHKVAHEKGAKKKKKTTKQSQKYYQTPKGSIISLKKEKLFQKEAWIGGGGGRDV